MKKKFLSLMMAAAVVATTSVSAFAAEPNVTGTDNKDATSDVQITGNVLSNNNTEPVGTFQVTVPTTSAFTVDKDGNFTTAGKITIKNDGTQNIDVYADKFVDTTATDADGITVVAENEIKSKNRTYVNLNISGALGTAYFKSEAISETNTGIYGESSLTTPIVGGKKLLNVQSGKSGDLNLNGSAGKVALDENSPVKENGATNNFTLTLRIKKSGK